MSDITPNELVRSSVDVVEINPAEKAWEESSTFMQGLIGELQKGADFSNLQAIDVDYTTPYSTSLKAYPKQFAAVITLNQPTWAKVWAGYLDPESDVIMGKRSNGRWGGGTWAVPMGKIELKDADKDANLGSAINNAAVRELDEETIRTSASERSLIASSFLDKETGNLIHVVFRETTENPINTTSLSVTLPDTREHEELGWMKLKDVPKLDNISNGVRYLFVSAVQYVQGLNQDLSANFSSKVA